MFIHTYTHTYKYIYISIDSSDILKRNYPN